MRSEKDRSGFQHPRTWLISFLVHGFANEYRTPEPKIKRFCLLDRQGGRRNRPASMALSSPLGAAVRIWPLPPMVRSPTMAGWASG
jgi:hypothetical protein